MHGATHLAWGVATGMAVGLALEAGPSELAATAAIGGLAGLIPDWLQINVPGVSAQIKGMFGHRGFSHWLWTPLAMLCIGQTFIGQMFANRPAMPSSSLVAAFFCGWASHIALDCLADGAPALWPLKRVTLAHIKTGGKADRLFGGAGLIMIGVGIWTALSSYLPSWPW